MVTPDSTEITRLRTDHGWTSELVSSQGVYVPRDVYSPESAYAFDQIQSHVDSAEGWWFSVRNQIIGDVLNRHQPAGALWDIGSGSGVVATYLRSVGREVVAVEPSMAGAVSSARDGGVALATDLASLRLPSGSISTIGMFDVLEHIYDRGEMLREIHRVLEPDGLLLLTLPALMLLWSDLDEMEHHLRYSRRSARTELEQAGFELVESGYCFMLPVVPLLLLRSIPYRLGLRQPIANETLARTKGGSVAKIIGSVERRLAMKAPFGSTLVVVARPSKGSTR